MQSLTGLLILLTIAVLSQLSLSQGELASIGCRAPEVAGYTYNIPWLVVDMKYPVLCTAHCSDHCLSGFTHTLPKGDLNGFATLRYRNSWPWRTYLFPSLRFNCKGTLETLEFVTAAKRSDYWNDVVGLYLSVWRPDGIAYTRVASKEFRISDTQSMWSSLLVNFSTDVAENDIVGVTWPPSSESQYKGIPLLLNASQAVTCPFTSDTCFVSYPLIKANFTPSRGKRLST